MVAALFSLAALRALELSRGPAEPLVARDASLRVRLQSAGRPVAGAQIELRGRGDTLCDGESGADGSALLEDLMRYVLGGLDALAREQRAGMTSLQNEVLVEQDTAKLKPLTKAQHRTIAKAEPRGKAKVTGSML